MNNLQVFTNSEFGKIQTVTIDGQPWFVGFDIAAALGYAQTNNMRKIIDADDIRAIDPQSTDFMGIMLDGVSPNVHNILVINESGLYSAIFGSTIPKAKKFKHWVTSEVLPSIRETGGYQLPQTTDGKIRLLAQGQVEINNRIDKVESDLDKLQKEMPLFPVDTKAISDAVKKKGVEILGGKHSDAYHDRSLVALLYRDIYSQIHRNFEVTSYQSIKRGDVTRVLDVIAGYRPPVVLADRISEKNEVAA